MSKSKKNQRNTSSSEGMKATTDQEAKNPSENQDSEGREGQQEENRESEVLPAGGATPQEFSREQTFEKERAHQQEVADEATTQHEKNRAQDAADQAEEARNKAQGAREAAEDSAQERQGTTVAQIVRGDGHVVREYNKEDHGRGFATLAETYAEKRGFSVRFK